MEKEEQKIQEAEKLIREGILQADNAKIERAQKILKNLLRKQGIWV